jgi:cation transport ATPase
MNHGDHHPTPASQPSPARAQGPPQKEPVHAPHESGHEFLDSAGPLLLGSRLKAVIGGKKVLVGNARFLTDEAIDLAPALAQADIGIAIGAGTDVAIEAAKIVLIKSDPLDVLNAILLSKATVRKMKQNLWWASVYKLLAIPVAAGAFYRLWGLSLRPEVSALLMCASSIIVAVNAVMLRRSGGRLLLTTSKEAQP